MIDLWAQRTAELGARTDVDDVLIFENRGREVGATIDHPHGQIYAFDCVCALTSGGCAAILDTCFARSRPCHQSYMPLWLYSKPIRPCYPPLGRTT